MSQNKSNGISNEDIIRRMKVLSVSQTTFLKAFLQAKLELAKSVVTKATNVIKELDDDMAEQILKDLERLRLDQIVVDINSAHILMHEELALMRESLSGDVGGGDANEQLRALSSENLNLRGLLKELKAQLLEVAKSNDSSGISADAASQIKSLKDEIATLKSKGTTAASAAPISTTSGGGANTAELDELKAKAKTLSSELADYKRKNQEQQSNISSLQSELDALTSSTLSKQSSKNNETINQINEINTLKSEVNSCNSEINRLKRLVEEYSAKISANESTLNEKNAVILTLQEGQSKASAASQNYSQEISELKGKVKALEQENKKVLSESNARVQEIEKKAGQDQENLMDAMAQELEDVQKKHEQESANMARETKKLQKSLQKYKSTSKSLSNGLVPVKKMIAELKTTKKSLLSEVTNQFNAMKSFIANDIKGFLISKLKNIELENIEINKKYRKEMMERKRLHNVIQELKGNIRVYMRVRPPSTQEIEQSGPECVCVSFPDEGQVRVLNEKGREKDWEFDEVFDFNTTQEKIYEEVSELVTSVLDGFNVCIFAYGQTGSGKTFTMTGAGGNLRGVNTRALEELFEKSALRTGDWRDVISVSVLEVYNEEIHDLLTSSDGDNKLDILRGDYGNYVPGLVSHNVSAISEVNNLFAIADRNRSQASTKMNEHSSRSHMMLQVTVVSESKRSNLVQRGKLSLVDLAGSERINKSGATGQALKEAQNINKSLSSLGDVIAARANKQAHIPFRNSKLTYLLEDSLSQDSKTLMFVCCSPVAYNSEETCCSLNFAARVKSVELGRASRTTLTNAKPSAASGTGSSTAAPAAKRK